jgi:hypothetical protein
MIQSPNYIHFRIQWQLVYPGTAETLFQGKKFRDLMDKINEDYPLDFSFKDFSDRTPVRCEMANTRRLSDGREAFSKFIYNNNSIAYIEEWAEISPDEFEQKCNKLLRVWFNLFPQTAIVAQNTCVRALVQPNKFKNSLDFLGDKILNVKQSIHNTFENMPFKIGFTFACPKKQPDCPIPIIIDTSINSWTDNKSVWIQVSSNSPLLPPVNAANIERGTAPVIDSKNFLEDEVLKLLNEYDK